MRWLIRRLEYFFSYRREKKRKVEQEKVKVGNVYFLCTDFETKSEGFIRIFMHHSQVSYPKASKRDRPGLEEI